MLVYISSKKSSGEGAENKLFFGWKVCILYISMAKNVANYPEEDVCEWVFLFVPT